mmetsp:Transcript_502/g.1137  ORF Transcript_502/g.1137 Transcript_502/m.1137 type:complete len:202 (-) Transcript_502:84-689(-)
MRSSILILLPTLSLSFSIRHERSPISRRSMGEVVVTSGVPLLLPFDFLQQPTPAFADDVYTTTDKGIKYQVTAPPTDSDSPSPVRGQKVKTKYTLWLNGFPEDTPSAQKIDSSKGPFGDKPFEFFAGVSQVIKGWDLTILDMKVGEERKLVIPAVLGYGEKGAGGQIPGGSTLYFKVELAEIGPAPSLNADQKKWLEDNPL